MDTLTPLLETFGIKLEPRDSEEAYGKASRIATKDPSEPSTPSLFGMLELFSSSTSPLESRTASSDDDEAGAIRGRFARPPSKPGSAASTPRSNTASITSRSRHGRTGSSGSATSSTKSRSRSRSNSQDRVSCGNPNSPMSSARVERKSSQTSLLSATWRSFKLFRGLSEDDMKKCINKMKVRTFNPGDIIITSMTVGTTMYFIDVGAARASVNGVAATDLKSGDYFGEIAFLATCKKVLGEKADEAQHHRRCPTLRQADVVATAPSRMLEFSVKDFVTVLKKNPDGNQSVLASLSRTCDQRLDNVERIQRKIRHHTAYHESSVQEAMGSSGMWF